MSTTPLTRVGKPNSTITSFEDFFEGWLVRQEHYLEELRSTLTTAHQSRDEDLRDLVSKVLAHYQEYYEEKSRVAHRDVFLVFSPPWFSAFERSFFWIAGVRPAMAFRVAAGAVEDLSEGQAERMERLKAETRAEEKELGDEMARIQEGLAAPAVCRAARRLWGAEEGGEMEMEAAMARVKAEMEAVVANADMLRTRTAERVAEILTAVQNIKFLAALTELQLNIRMWGSHLSW